MRMSPAKPSDVHGECGVEVGSSQDRHDGDHECAALHWCLLPPRS
jgi:hypothetical protein